MAEMNYNGQTTARDANVDVAKVEKAANQRARDAANSNPAADLASAAESAEGDDPDGTTLMS